MRMRWALELINGGSMTREEERTKGNEAGAKLGSRTCPVCGDSAFWKPFHDITYFEGTIELEHERARPDLQPPRCEGSKAMSFVCEECWPKLSVDDRLRKLDELTQQRIGALVPVVYMLGDQHVEEKQGDQVVLVRKSVRVVDEQDKARYERQKAAIQKDHDFVAAAIKAGG